MGFHAATQRLGRAGGGMKPDDICAGTVKAVFSSALSSINTSIAFAVAWEVIERYMKKVSAQARVRMRQKIMPLAEASLTVEAVD